jgi:CRP-like cAMP-binding protein
MGRADVETLRRIPLFSDIDDGLLARVADVCTEFEAPAGWVLVEVGQPGSGMFVLESGTVEVELPDGRAVELGPGEFFGEMALLSDQPRTARVRAVSDVRCVAISRMDFARLLEEEPKIAAAMLAVMAERLADTI